MARIAVGLGGRVAEELTFGPDRVTTGAENDLQVVTDLARRMVTRWGMSEQVGVVFADYRAGAGSPGLKMRRVELDDLSTGPRSLVVGADNNLLLNGGDLPARQQYILAMTAPEAHRSTSASMASFFYIHVHDFLPSRVEIACNFLLAHSDP